MAEMQAVMAGFDCDVVIIGAGLAGAASAAKLGERGASVVLLEARKRVGGRAYARAFAGEDGEALEFGGAWITPWHHRIRALAARHGLALRPRHPVTTRLWLRDGGLHDEGPTSAADRPRHERAIARVAADALLMKTGHEADEQGRPLTGVSFRAYLDRLDPPQATRDLFSAWWTVSGNGDHDRVAASEFLASCAYGDGLAEGMIDVWVETVSPGMAVLAERMIVTSGAALRLNEPVQSIAQDQSGVTVSTVSASIRAKAGIVALGVNQMAGLVFEPPLSPSQTAAVARGHGGRAFKLWAKLRGVAVGTLATGGGRGVEFAFAERASDDGAALVVAFGIQRDGDHPGKQAWVAAELGKFFPSAQLIAHDWHDWLADPYARGTWVAAPVGAEPGLDWRGWRPQGRLAFAGSDIAREQAGWFEAAVISGEEAAEAVGGLL
ncbi:MAG: flavin monoamine oxidase family protein [Kiloniellales bacterium]